MNKPVDKKRLQFYMLVGGAWLLVWLLNAAARYTAEFAPRALNEIWRATYLVVINFIFFEYVVPQLTSKRPFRSILLFVAMFLLFGYGLLAWRGIGIWLHVHTVFTTLPSSHIVSAQFESVVSSFVFFGIIRHIYNYIKLKQATQQLRIEKQEAELNYLKSQTNPHFLFNTLNNIYSLARDKI